MGLDWRLDFIVQAHPSGFTPNLELQMRCRRCNEEVDGFASADVDYIVATAQHHAEHHHCQPQED